MADTIGMQIGDGLEDGFGSVRLSSMDRLFHEMVVQVVIGFPVIFCRVSVFCACQIEPDYRNVG